MIRFEQPVRDGIRRTQHILFPLAFGKWITLAFCAWLARGARNGFYYNHTYNTPGVPGENPLTRLSIFGIPWEAVLAGILVLVLAFVLLLRWLAARGRFMLLDNIVHNRALVSDPWKRFGKPANNLFLFEIVICLVAVPAFLLFFSCVAGVILFLTFLSSRLGLNHAFGHVPEVFISFVPLCFLLLIVSFMWLWDFVVPVMYKTGSTPDAAALRVWRLALARPGDTLLYLLIRLGVGILIILSELALCLATCCLGCLPFVFSFVTLPLAVFRQSFILDCLRQLDPELNLWPEAETPPAP